MDCQERSLSTILAAVPDSSKVDWLVRTVQESQVKSSNGSDASSSPFFLQVREWSDMKWRNKSRVTSPTMTESDITANVQKVKDSNAINNNDENSSDDDNSDAGGFLGQDFCHSADAPVRVFDYLLTPARKGSPPSTQQQGMTSSISCDSFGQNELITDDTNISTQCDEFPSIESPVIFTARAESHRGLCHGGSMCALMDDAIGWMGFCVDGVCSPWSGYTVQVNTSLRKSVPVGSVLKLEAWVNRKEGTRKYWIGARLSDPVTGTVHCSGEGLFLKNKHSNSKINCNQ